MDDGYAPDGYGMMPPEDHGGGHMDAYGGHVPGMVADPSMVRARWMTAASFLSIALASP